jgi:hypothetical protein
MAHLMVDPIDPVILDRLTQLAARVLDVPVVCVSLVDEHHNMVSSCGLRAPTSSAVSPRLMNLMVMSTPHVGIPLVASDGHPVGTLRVMDCRPCRWNAPQIDFLRELAVRLVAQVDIGPVERMM